MYDKPPITKTEKKERTHTPEEIILLIQQMIGEKDYKETRRKMDDKGVYLLELTTTENSENTEYTYMRAGKYPEGQALNTVINIVFYDSDGIPVGGHNLADFIDGKWKKTT